jgi:5'-nucleotidase
MRYFSLIIACFSILAMQAQKELVIINTNDTHSTVMPLSSNLDDTLKAGRAGYLRRLALLEEQRKGHPDLMLFDCGDFSQGSPYYTMFKGEVEVKLMNMMKYDAVALGNHEFDNGMDNLARLIDMSEFAWLSANYDFSATVLKDKVKPYVVLERDDVKIGVFGLTPKLEGLASIENIEGAVYKDPIESAKAVVSELRSESVGCDVVVCLSHLGWNMYKQMDDSTLIANTSGIDLVLGGHTHTYFQELQYVKNAEGKDVPVDQNGKHGIFIGKQRLFIQSKE